MKETILVDVPGVAGVEEAVRVEGIAHRHFDVLLHQRRAGDGDLAFLVRVERCTGFRVEDADLVPRKDQAGRAIADLRRRIGWDRRDDRERLGEAERRARAPGVLFNMHAWMPAERAEGFDVSHRG